VHERATIIVIALILIVSILVDFRWKQLRDRHQPVTSQPS
jgi:hypothetical protein